MNQIHNIQVYLVVHNQPTRLWWTAQITSCRYWGNFITHLKIILFFGVFSTFSQAQRVQILVCPTHFKSKLSAPSLFILHFYPTKITIKNWMVPKTLNDLLTRNHVDIISPWPTFAVSTSIRLSVLPVGYVSPRTSSTPSLMLYSKGPKAVHYSIQRTLLDGFASSSVVTCK